MRRRGVILLGLGLAGAITLAVVGLAAAIGGLAMMITSVVALVFLPTLLPFLLLAGRSRVPRPAIALVAAPLVLGWAYVIYVDSQPYGGGGASMAVLLGWAACVVSAVLAILTLVLTPLVAKRL